MTLGCQYAANERTANPGGERLLVYQTFYLFGKPIEYLVPPLDKEEGLARTAVCCDTGNQFNIPLSGVLRQRLGINETVVRATLINHSNLREGEEDRFTINGTDHTINMSELVGEEIDLLDYKTEVISTFLAFPAVARPAPLSSVTHGQVDYRHGAMLSAGVSEGAYAG